MGCAKKTDSFSAMQPIESYRLNNQTQIYAIMVNKERVGDAQTSILNGAYVSAHGGRVIQLKQTVTINHQTGSHELFLKDRVDGIFISQAHDVSLAPFITLPIQLGSVINGPFGGLTTGNVLLEVRKIHPTFVSATGYSFDQVIEAQNADGSIRLYFNESHFIIQQEDNRYAPSVTSILIPDQGM